VLRRCLLDSVDAKPRTRLRGPVLIYGLNRSRRLLERADGSLPEYHLLMKVVTGTVVNGTVKVDDPEFEEGSEVFILSREREEDVRLSPEELTELEAGIAEADRGETIAGDIFLARLRRYG